jgi:hypothetical protein
VALIVSGVASGLFAGLMMTLVIALQPMWGALGADGYGILSSLVDGHPIGVRS